MLLAQVFEKGDIRRNMITYGQLRSPKRGWHRDLSLVPRSPLSKARSQKALDLLIVRATRMRCSLPRAPHMSVAIETPPTHPNSHTCGVSSARSAQIRVLVRSWSVLRFVSTSGASLSVVIERIKKAKKLVSLRLCNLINIFCKWQLKPRDRRAPWNLYSSY